ncbi:MerR family transcriptional regulator [Kineococcus sp. NUM-3379]
MRISELGRATGVPVATVKYYLREGLLPPGRATGATQAQYGEEHVRRLRLVRALVDVGGLPLARVRDVLACLDDPPPTLHEALRIAHDALGPTPLPTAGGADAEAVVAAAGWRVSRDSPAFAQLGAALAALGAAGQPTGPDALAGYVRVAGEVAEAEVAAVPRGDFAAAVEYVVLGTVLYEPVLLALRRLAQQHFSATTLG